MRKFWNTIHSFFMDGERIELELNWIRRIWYIILLIGTSIYVFKNFSELTNFTFFNQFNGKNLIFILWLILVLMPLFDNFEGFGIRFNTHKMRKSNESLNQLAHDIIDGIPKTPSELKEEIDKINKSNDDE